MGVSLAGVLKAERASDLQISSVARFVEALGGNVTIVASVRRENYRLTFQGASKMNHSVSTSGTTSLGAWRIRAWGDPGLEESFLSENIIAISEDDIATDVRTIPSDADLRIKIQALHVDRKAVAIGIFLTYWRDFSVNMQVGDWVALPLSGRRVALGTIAGDYEYVAAHDEPKLRHRRSVRWLKVTERDNLPESLRKTVNAPGTICRFGAANASSQLKLISG
ncbi:hypothetical protein [Rhodococcus globerulus]|uniref:hypothetical protein n=1 Tax=Rhodococcus globerulus TaxID=33008 RepID=UPI0030188495